MTATKLAQTEQPTSTLIPAITTLVSKIAMLVWASVWAQAVQAIELTSASLKTEFAYGYGLERHQPAQAQLELTPRLEWAVANGTLVLESRFRYDEAGELDGFTANSIDASARRPNYSNADRPHPVGDKAQIELRDAFYEFNLGSHLFRLGKQQIVWGALDGLKVADVLNPQSFREFILDDFGHSRIPLWSALADLSFGNWRAELAWVPQTSAHELPDAQAWFALRAARFNLGQELDPTNMAAVTANRSLPTASPNNKLNRGGLRLSGRIGPLDTSLVAARTLDFEPQISLRNTNTPGQLERSFSSSTFYGITLESAVGALALRAEVGLRNGRRFNTLPALSTQTGLTQPGITRADQLTVAVAADINAPGGWFVNLQLLRDSIRSAPTDLVRPKRDTIATLLLRRQFFYDTLTLDVRWYGSRSSKENKHSGLGRVKVTYALNDNASLSLGMDRFYGPVNGLFGQFSQADRITLRFTHVF